MCFPAGSYEKLTIGSEGERPSQHPLAKLDVQFVQCYEMSGLRRYSWAPLQMLFQCPQRPPSLASFWDFCFLQIYENYTGWGNILLVWCSPRAAY